MAIKPTSQFMRKMYSPDMMENNQSKPRRSVQMSSSPRRPAFEGGVFSKAAGKLKIRKDMGY